MNPTPRMMYGNLGNASNRPSNSSSSSPRNPISYPLLQQHHHPITNPLPPPSLPPFCTSPSGGSGAGFSGGADADDEFSKRDDRFPQWSNQETRDFIQIKGEMEGGFTTTKGNENIWEMVSSRMREKGYRRTPHQCKYKWENLVNGYKGQETSDLDNDPQCPFFEDLHAFFTARANKTQQVQPVYEAGLTKGRKRLKKIVRDQSSEEISDREDDGGNTGSESARRASVAPKMKAGRERRQRTGQSVELSRQANTNVNNDDSVLGGLRQVLKDFFHQQERIDVQWMGFMEKSAQKRDVFEQEWRQTMEKLERERLTMEHAWREREEQRRMKEETRAEKRDALLNTLLNKLIEEDSG